MRMADDGESPAIENAARAKERQELAERVRTALAGDAESLGAFEVGLSSAATFIPGRERSKTAIIRVIHEGRMAACELGRRFAAQGRLDDPSHVFMLFLDELTELVAGNVPDVKDLIPPRLEHRRWLASLEPPFIISGEARPNSEWPEAGSRPVAGLAVGDRIVGVPGCPGRAKGRARVVLHPTNPAALEPGDILVAPATDPSWTPLFVPAAAVVVDVGAALSHAVIVSRELGIPCVPSAVDATRRIPDGAIVEVDGDNGTVTVIELPN
jgi:pyruvate,water dikinase